MNINDIRKFKFHSKQVLHEVIRSSEGSPTKVVVYFDEFENKYYQVDEESCDYRVSDDGCKYGEWISVHELE